MRGCGCRARRRGCGPDSQRSLSFSQNDSECSMPSVELSSAGQSIEFWRKGVLGAPQCTCFMEGAVDTGAQAREACGSPGSGLYVSGPLDRKL